MATLTPLNKTEIARMEVLRGLGSTDPKDIAELDALEARSNTDAYNAKEAEEAAV